ncbi:hypothetical protein A2W24_00445 [Microgenomates group bacterium RBG_16_45_19]|nr:MAG: hypothetical protein A2W24_00445 [Microgenomates group bacterium RBG_16_45_19]
MDLQELFFGNHPINQYAQRPVTELISKILPNVYVILGLILFIYLLIGGFMVIASAGNQHNLDQGKQIITNAIIGFIVVFASYWIIQAIEILTGLDIL